MFFYSTDAAGQSTGSQTLYIPYLGVAVVVVVLAAIFYFASVPDIKAKDEYHLDEKDAAVVDSGGAERRVNRLLVYGLLVLNAAVLIGICGMILWLILSLSNMGQRLVGAASWIAQPTGMKVTADNSLFVTICAAGALLALAAAVVLVPVARRLSHHSMWSHPHFSAATAAQFFYVAAQAGIFSFLINYVTEECPPLPAACRMEMTKNWVGIRTRFTKDDITSPASFADKLKKKPDAVSVFLSSQLSPETAAALASYNDSTADLTSLRSALAEDLRTIVSQDPKKAEKAKTLYDPQRFRGIHLSEETQQLVSNSLERKKEPTAEDSARLNRMLLRDAYPGELAYNDGILGISDELAAYLVTVGFVCFLTGRFSGAALLKKFSAHKILGLYGTMNVLACLLVFLKLGWLSVACVFLSYFFMSIMFPTIFALGIYGLGARAKTASAFIVMAIMGGAILPKLMGKVADDYDMSRGFIVPMACFVLVALYGFCWPKLSNAESLHGAGTPGDH